MSEVLPDGKPGEEAAGIFPTATIQDEDRGLLRSSKMWWVTGLCMLLALWLTWQSRSPSGKEIIIQFPEGHGLKTGDLVRFRGIEVGLVTAVTLRENLSGINVAVSLTPSGGELDREGTRFWIVRPRLSLTEFTGLDTAIGAKYIAVSPGDANGPHQREFAGLAVAPPDELTAGGLELVLRSDDRHGIGAGSPIIWRGVTVGQVISVNLSPDARHVDFGVRVDRSYRRLLRRSSKFWIHSGFGVDLSLTGVKVNAQSLQSIVQGGISFISPPSEDATPIRSGQVFELANEPDPDWLESASSVPFIDLELPETVAVEGLRTISVFGIRRERPFLQHGLVVNGNGGPFLITANVPMIAVEGAKGPQLADLRIQPVDGNAIELKGVSALDCRTVGKGILMIPGVGLPVQWDQSRFRAPTSPEECIVVRSAVTDGKATPVIQAIDSQMLEDDGETWAVSHSELDFTQWHGAPVVAVSDGKVIGILISTDGEVRVAAYRPRSEGQ